MKTTSAILSSVALVALAAGCGSKQKPTATAAAVPAKAGGARTAAAAGREGIDTQSIDRDGRVTRFDPIYFPFDSFDLDQDARTRLSEIASHLGANPTSVLTIEGHCDERGTPEYNVALGERRATAIRDYLVRLGTASSRLSIISYGEERPAVAGTGEAAWQQNRRGEFVPGR